MMNARKIRDPVDWGCLILFSDINFVSAAGNPKVRNELKMRPHAMRSEYMP